MALHLKVEHIISQISVFRLYIQQRKLNTDHLYKLKEQFFPIILIIPEYYK